MEGGQGVGGWVGGWGTPNPPSRSGRVVAGCGGAWLSDDGGCCMIPPRSGSLDEGRRDPLPRTAPLLEGAGWLAAQAVPLPCTHVPLLPAIKEGSPGSASTPGPKGRSSKNLTFPLLA